MTTTDLGCENIYGIKQSKYWNRTDKKFHWNCLSLLKADHSAHSQCGESEHTREGSLSAFLFATADSVYHSQQMVYLMP